MPHLFFPHLHPPFISLQELQDLAGITSTEAAAASRTASALRQRRLSIRLCRASYDLLTQHLQVGHSVYVWALCSLLAAMLVAVSPLPLRRPCARSAHLPSSIHQVSKQLAMLGVVNEHIKFEVSCLFRLL